MVLYILLDALMPMQIPINTLQFYVKIHGSSSHRRGFFVVPIGILTRSESPTNFGALQPDQQGTHQPPEENVWEGLKMLESWWWKNPGLLTAAKKGSRSHKNHIRRKQYIYIYIVPPIVSLGCVGSKPEHMGFEITFYYFNYPETENNWNTWGFNLI